MTVATAELIPVHTNPDGGNVVMGRDLHEFLEVTTRYNDWMGRLIKKYGFVAGQDFYSKMSKSSGGRRQEDHIITLDMAKELSMVQNNDRGRQARQYFIECERRMKQLQPELTPEQLMAKALLQAEQTMLEQTQAIEALNTRVEDMEPSYNLGEALLSTEDNIYVGDMAKMLKSRGLFYGGRTKLFAWLKDNDYIMKTGSSGYAALQRWLDRGVLDVEEHVYEPFFGEPKLRYTIKVTPKGQEHFINKFKKELALS
ncbi:antA/AntB antirepressor family protein [Corynebacterium pseudodiphtheriticum]|uniref:antA/AntB antirepressor family protein n=1 Tax=Corynebacterium pseudodiphtheriticum TaxID=37637 RepID=UPI00254393D6|nr:antA/AntB antirepressor family protein [Corynebacterium pseudodiphtheriticum]MDK4206964.1 antA/AntB antirepressor family protein [Corynebacterium pseudodiphtheriticum]